jgi:opacity protein-like surface antigen
MKSIVCASLAICGLLSFAQPASAVVTKLILDGQSIPFNSAWDVDGLGNFFALGGIYGIHGDHQADVFSDGGLGAHITNSVPIFGALTPYNYTPLSGAQYGLSVASSTALTVPAGTTYAVVCAETATVRYTTSGTTPTASVGIPLFGSSTSAPCVPLQGPLVIAAFRAISSGGGTIDAEYFQ